MTEQLLVAKSSRLYHDDPGCRVLKLIGRPRPKSRATVEAAGLQHCPICRDGPRAYVPTGHGRQGLRGSSQ